MITKEPVLIYFFLPAIIRIIWFPFDIFLAPLVTYTSLLDRVYCKVAYKIWQMWRVSVFQASR